MCFSAGPPGVPRAIGFPVCVRFDIMYMSSFTINGPVRLALTEVFPSFNYRWVTDRRIPGFAPKVHATDFRKSLRRRSAFV